MDLQRTMNKLKRIIDELWDLRIKKELEELDADDKTRLEQIQSEITKIEAHINEVDVKNSAIQEAIQSAKELNDEICGYFQANSRRMTLVEKSAKEVIDEILNHPNVYLQDTEEEPNKREENVNLLKECSKYLGDDYRRDEIERIISHQ